MKKIHLLLILLLTLVACSNNEEVSEEVKTSEQIQFEETYKYVSKKEVSNKIQYTDELIKLIDGSSLEATFLIMTMHHLNNDEGTRQFSIVNSDKSGTYKDRYVSDDYDINYVSEDDVIDVTVVIK